MRNTQAVNVGTRHWKIPSIVWLVQTCVVILVGTIVIAPILPILFQSLIKEPLYSQSFTFTFWNYVTLVSSSEIYQLLITTILYATCVAIASTAFGVCMAILVTRTDMYGGKIIGSLFTIPIYTSSLVLAFAWVAVYGPGGYVSGVMQTYFGFRSPDLFGFWGMVVVGSVAYTAIPYLYCVSALSLADPTHEQAAQICGASRSRTLFSVTVPLLRPAISYALLMNFVTGIELLSVPLILGEPVGIRTFSSYLYAEISKSDPSYGLVACAGVILLSMMALLIMAQRKVLGDSRRFVTVQGKAKAPKPLKLGASRLSVSLLCWVIVLAVVVVPMVGLVMRSFTALLSPLVSPFKVLTLANYWQILEFETYSRSIVNSIFVAAVGAAFAACLAFSVVLVADRSDHPWARPLRFLALFPQAVPGVIVGVGMLWAFIIIPGGSFLRMTLLGLILAFTARYLPLAVGAIAPSMAAIGKDQDRAARTSGASWFDTSLHILFPLLRSSFASAYILLFLSFLREYTSAVFLYVPGTEVIGTTLLSLWKQGETGPVAALATIQIAIVAVIVLIGRYAVGARAKSQAAPRRK